MPPRVHSPSSRAGARSGPFAADTFETSQLLLELIHVAYATRGADSTAAVESPAGPVAGEPPSTHAIRAAIHVYQHGERTIGELAAGLGISYGWASRVVSGLEASGLVARRPDPDDRRVVRVSLTPPAIEMVEDAYRWRGDAVERALASLDEDGRRAVISFLRRVTHELAAAAQERRPLAG
jgi:DNA-binding MarR family transcriptional regulator